MSNPSIIWNEVFIILNISLPYLKNVCMLKCWKRETKFELKESNSKKLNAKKEENSKK